MLKLVYAVEKEKLESELEWLKGQKIFPSTFERWDFKTERYHTLIGVIVSEPAALAIKLKHHLISQVEYRQR